MPQFLRVLRTRWLLLVGVGTIGMGWTVFLTLSATPLYASSATLLVSAAPEHLTDAYVAVQATRERANSYAHLVTDRKVLQDSADRLGAEVDGADLADRVSARVLEDSVLLVIEVRAESPEKAQRIAKVVSEEVLRTIRTLEDSGEDKPPLPIVANLASDASLNQSAVEPDIPVSLATGFSLSLLVGVATVTLRDVLDATVTSSADVQSLTGGLPMAALPLARRSRRRAANDVGAVLREALKVLRTNLQFADLDGRRQIILVTSADAGEGRTFVAAELAVALAETGRSVLLLDADLRSPGVDSYLGLDGAIGLADVLVGGAALGEVIQRHSSGLGILSAGTRLPNPVEVLGSKSMADVLAALRAGYDLVVIDAPPLLPVADAPVLLPQVDGALVVVRYGVTGREQLRQVVAQCGAAGGRMLGVVINGASCKTAAGYGYGSRGDRGGRRRSQPAGRRARR